MAGWLNTPVLIESGARRYTEEQQYWIAGVLRRRTRTTTIANERYVGGDKTAADAKANTLTVLAGYSEVATNEAGGGQYHVVATKTTKEDWTAWDPPVPVTP